MSQKTENGSKSNPNRMGFLDKLDYNIQEVTNSPEVALIHPYITAELIRETIPVVAISVLQFPQITFDSRAKSIADIQNDIELHKWALFEAQLATLIGHFVMANRAHLNWLLTGENNYVAELDESGVVGDKEPKLVHLLLNIHNTRSPKQSISVQEGSLTQASATNGKVAQVPVLNFEEVKGLPQQEITDHLIRFILIESLKSKTLFPRASDGVKKELTKLIPLSERLMAAVDEGTMTLEQATASALRQMPLSELLKHVNIAQIHHLLPIVGTNLHYWRLRPEAMRRAHNPQGPKETLEAMYTLAASTST